jgi:hypothetical protein
MVHLSVHDNATVTDSVSVTAQYAKQRPWQEKWEEAQQQRTALFERIYAGEQPAADVSEWRSAAYAAFQACHELLDAVLADPGVARDAADHVRQGFRSDRWLKLVGDVNNTRKHGGPTHGNALPTLRRFPLAIVRQR